MTPFMPSLTKSPRFEVVDALRGFAIVSIMLLHNLEHFDFYFFPDFLPLWLKTLDGAVWKTLFFLFAGKAYAIFALLFGLTFFIQFNNQKKKGTDFSYRFIWRLFLLLIFGLINSMFYEGDILTIYAIIGIVLVPFRKAKSKIVLLAAIIFMLQPFELGRVIYILTHPDYVLPVRLSDAYFGRIGEYLATGSFINAVKGNLINGKIAVLFWSWENGRYFQSAALFLLGMLLGREGKFIVSDSNTMFWKKSLIISALLFVPLFIIKIILHGYIANEALSGTLMLIITSWSNFAFMVVLVSLFTWLFQKEGVKKILGKVAPIGRMSLSNYVIQSILGSFIYYGFGLGLYKYTGATFCLFIGLALATIQLFFSRWWLERHRQGPLEYLWHKATWVQLSRKVKVKSQKSKVKS
jgi:uncharacterized protein